jgi:hypothetical protein
MKKSWFRNPDPLAITIFVVLVCGVIPFVFMHDVWGELLQKVYLLTSLLLFAALWSNWESIAERWFWKAMLLIILVHSGIVVGIAKLNLAFPGIDQLPGLVYGSLAMLFTGEIFGSMRIIEAYRPKPKRRG